MLGNIQVSSPDRARRVLLRPILVVGLTVAATALILVIVAAFPLNSDVAWLMTMARRALDGEELYRDLVEVTPPLVVYALMPAVVVSDVTGIADSTAVIVIFFSIAGVVTLWSLHLLGLWGESGRSACWFLLMGFATLIVPAFDFGQKEHLMVLLTFPFLAVKWRRISHLNVGTLEGFLAGSLAALGFAIKPHFVLPWLAVELLAWFRRRKGESPIKPESLAVAITGCVYLVFVALVHSSYFSLMWELAGLYRSFSSDTYRLLFIAYFALPTFLVLLAALHLKDAPYERNLALVLLTFGCGSLLAALIQGKGWRYHSLPMIISTALAWGVLFAQVVRLLAGRMLGADRLRAAFVLGVLMIGAYLFSVSLTYAMVLAQENRVWIAERTQDVAPFYPRSILVFGDVVAHAFPLVNELELRSSSPFPSMWWLRVIYGTSKVPDLSRTGDRRTEVERNLANMLIDDFVENQPDIVLVDTTEHERFGGQAFPYIEYFSRDSAFARIWRGYERVGGTSHFSIWRARKTGGLPQTSVPDKPHGETEAW